MGNGGTTRATTAAIIAALTLVLGLLGIAPGSPIAPAGAGSAGATPAGADPVSTAPATPEPATSESLAAMPQVTAGQYHTCGIRTDGTATCWGADGSGEAPATLAGTWTQITAGGGHTCGIHTDGTATCWGDDARGQAPETLTGTWTRLTAGDEHTCGIRTDGTATCWGWDVYGQAPGDLTGTWTHLSAGRFFTCGIRGDGTATCWGQNTDGQAPSTLTGTWADLATGDYHACGTRPDGTATCWGWDNAGQAPGDLDGTWTDIAAGQLHTCGIRTDGTATCWGDDGAGQAPGSLPGTWADLTAGEEHTCGVRTDGTATCWGEDFQGQLGPVVTSAAPAAGLIDVAYSHQFTARTPAIFSVAAGALPTGLSLAVDGTVSGTPTAAGDSEVTVTATNGVVSFDQTVTFSIQAPNDAPVADAGPDQTVHVGDEVTLDGTGSSDPDDDPLTHEWTQTAGPTVTLSGADTATPSFTAPAGPSTIEVTLTVDDGTATDTDTVTVTIDNSAPTADAGPDQVDTTGSAVFLDGTGSSDPDGSPLSYSWTQTGGPTVTLGGADTAEAFFTTPSTPSTLVFELTVDDGTATATDTVTVTVTPANSAPVADAGPDQTVHVDDEVTLDGTGSSDPDDDPLTYAWTQTAGPTVTLSGADTATPSFTAPAGPSTIEVTLTVDDGTATDTDTVTVTIDNSTPIADAGADQSAFVGDTVTLDGSGSSDPDDDSLTYAWQELGGSTVTLSDPSAVQPTFTAPSGPASLTFRLTVTDEHGATDTDTVAITLTTVPSPSEAWVIGVYDAFLQRSPDPASLTYWADRLDSGTSKRTVATQIGFSLEATGGPTLTAVYRQALDRDPWPGERAYWTDQLRDGMELHHLIRHVLSSAEAYANAGGTDEAWLTHLYQALLGRSPGAGEVAFWTGVLADGTPRHVLAGAFQNTPEARAVIIDTLAGALLTGPLAPENYALLDEELRTTRDPRATTVTLLTWI